MLCVSGAVAVFKDELNDWVDGMVRAPAAVPPLDQAMARLRAGLPAGQRPRRLELPTASRGYELRSQEGLRLRLDAAGGVVVMEASHGIADFLVNYHTRLFMGHPGRWFIGAAGLLLLASIITGVLMHRRILRHLFTLRLRPDNPRLAYADSHKAAGVWGLPFHILVAVTGAWLGLYGLLAPEWAGPAPPPGPAKPCGTAPGLECLVAETRRAIPGFVPVFVDFGKGGDTVAVRGDLPGRLFRRHEAGVVFDLETGRATAVDAPALVSTARRVDLAMAPLHFGDYAGVAVQGLYAVLGLLGAGLSITGVLMWSRRGHARQRRRRLATARILCAAAGGNGVATFALPLLAVGAAAGMGPGFSGSMRLGDLFRPEVAPVLPVFLVLWVAAGLFLLRAPGLRDMAARTLAIIGLLCLAAPAAAMALRLHAGLPPGDVLRDGVSVALWLGGAVALLGAWYLGAGREGLGRRVSSVAPPSSTDWA
ncbi:MAG: PepSY-associated TM helix domain-containing protein [Gammaproteobacteria bacterium]|nr:PepSY-associated TM helix domain-containing protein [Gammaproteobacteria bacterium]